ncbi:hypothetical protein STRCI_000227 [Streptomyces cinnabarinus]|uniref:Uncharacterized protein n=1 Tax=Streptomyces cinnabarinus TaxID=67287 RepID=A0ABY7K4X0_9ACTN|nr:hypothetical protein [Streptomyces cinnabarinus]WAZ19193.1 hypothetical protein STRCI_000227 [Streptomyces cinnabarinus]
MAYGLANGPWGSAANAALAAGAAAIVGAAALVVQEWLARRSAHVRRKRGIEEATAYLAFLEQWLTTYEAVRPGAEIDRTREAVAGSLDTVLREVEALLEETRRAAHTSFGDRAKRALLLYESRSVGARRVKIAFYFNGSLWLGASLGYAFDSSMSAQERISQSLGWGLWGVVTTVALGLWATHLDRGGRAGPAA